MTEPAEKQETELPLSRYAEAAAHLAHFRKANPAEVIDRLGIEAGDFKAAQEHWTSAIGDELERQETTLARRLGAVFAPTRQRLGDSQPTLESIGPRTSERVKPLAEAAKEEPAAIAPAREAPPLPALTALKEPEAPSIASFTITPRPAAIVPPPSMIAPPLIISTPPPDNARSSWGEVAAASPPSREDLVPIGMRHFTSLAGTQLASDAPTSTPALPFVRGVPPGPPKPPAPSALVPEGMRRFTSLTGTQGPIDAPSGPSLSFNRSPVATASTEPVESLMSLEGYTRLHVELARDPANRRAIIQRHGLDEPRLLRLDAHWGPRIKADAGLRAIWDSTYAAHRARLGGPEGPPR